MCWAFFTKWQKQIIDCFKEYCHAWGTQHKILLRKYIAKVVCLLHCWVDSANNKQELWLAVTLLPPAPFLQGPQMKELWSENLQEAQISQAVITHSSSGPNMPARKNHNSMSAYLFTCFLISPYYISNLCILLLYDFFFKFA